MQHDHVLKKLNLDLLTPFAGSGVCRQNICFHVAALMIYFNVICNMTGLKKLNFDLLTQTPQATQGVRHRLSIENQV